MKKVITDMRSICTYCGHKLTKEETDRLHCPYCKVNLWVICYPWRNRLVERKEFFFETSILESEEEE